MHCQDYFPAFVNLMLNTSLVAVVTTKVKEIVKVSGWKLLGFSIRTPSCKMARELSCGVIWGIANPRGNRYGEQCEYQY